MNMLTEDLYIEMDRGKYLLHIRFLLEQKSVGPFELDTN